ncbi:MAG: epoxyqueuosine reductase QueH [Candidatus Ratteibacteria bacterium]|nr:epoxyqueuosine reductase QueH [Candidatus Ratteibacteria bacterium]
MDKKILLHICCAVCAVSAIEQLKNEGWQVTGFFYNPNIHPEEEYIKRLNDTKLLLSKLEIPLIEGKYDKDKWFNKIKDFEEEKEGGKRCEICFRMRLEETLKEAKQHNIRHFTTTLTISPHKDSKIVNTIGQSINGDFFVVKDFKKKDGFKRAVRLSKEYNLYHQHYCGCIYSLPR